VDEQNLRDAVTGRDDGRHRRTRSTRSSSAIQHSRARNSRAVQSTRGAVRATHSTVQTGTTARSATVDAVATHSLGKGNPAIHAVFEAVVRRVGGGAVDANGYPAKEAVIKAVAKVDVVKKGVRVRVLHLCRHNAVVSVLRDGDGVGVVRVARLDRVDEVLIPEELADVGGVAGGERVIRQNSSVQPSDLEKY